MGNELVYANGLDYLEQHKEERRCFICKGLLDECETYLCTSCEELVEQGR